MRAVRAHCNPLDIYLYLYSIVENVLVVRTICLYLYIIWSQCVHKNIITGVRNKHSCTYCMHTCLCGAMCSTSAWTSLMHCVKCSRPACVIVGRHICLGTARWLLWEPSNILKQFPEMAIKRNFTLLYLLKVSITYTKRSLIPHWRFHVLLIVIRIQLKWKPFIRLHLPKLNRIKLFGSGRSYLFSAVTTCNDELCILI